MKFETFCAETRSRARKLFEPEDIEIEFSDERLREYFVAGYTTPKLVTDYLLRIFAECQREAEWEAMVS